jgi:outer membrane protein TolC
MKRASFIIIIIAAITAAPLAAFPAPADSAAAPLPIDEAIAIALADNAALMSLRQEGTKARAFKLQADGASAPAISLNANVNAQKEPQTASGRYDGRSATVTLEQALYTGGRNEAMRRQSAQVKSIAELNLEDAENRAVGELFARFFNVLLQERYVETENAAIATSELHLREVTRMSELGLSNRLEVIRASQRLAANKADLATAEGLYDSAVISLMNFLSIPPEARRPVTGSLVPMDITGSREESLEAAMRNRADLAAAKQQIGYQRNQIEIERGALRPRVSIGASAGVMNPYKNEPADGDTWKAELTLSLPILDRDATRSAVIKAEAVAEQNEIAYAQKELDIKSETETAWTELETARERLESTAQALALAEETLRLAEVGFNEGVTPQLDLLSAQVSLTESRLDHLRSLYNNLLAVVALKVTEGDIIGWAGGMNFR